jgi:hypothetical protein
MFYYFDSVQISEQFTYILASVKAVLPRYLLQSGVATLTAARRSKF